VNIDFFPAIIICSLIIIYGIFVFNGKLLWFLKDYKIRFKDENDKNKLIKSYKNYGIIIISIGLLLSIICIFQYIMGIDTFINKLY
jgi:hypothetical protein